MLLMIIKLARTPTVIKLQMDNPPAWAKSDGIELRLVEPMLHGELMVRFGKTAPGTIDRHIVRGFENQITGLYAFQFAAKDMKAKLQELFGTTEATLGGVGDDFIDIILPAERSPMRPMRTYKNKGQTLAVSPKPSQALAPIKEAIKTMAKESPPPGFNPAIPLREAIDTINAYRVAEGDNMELSISKRGRLKVKYEYGG
jgi:hypothetical protein